MTVTGFAKKELRFKVQRLHRGAIRTHHHLSVRWTALFWEESLLQSQFARFGDRVFRIPTAAEPLVSVKFSSVIHLTVDDYYLRGFGFISISV